MTRRILLAGVVIVFVAACGSSRKDAYERVAKLANPVIQAMRPTATRLFSLNKDDHVAIIDSCKAADEQLWSLRDIHFENDDPAPAPSDLAEHMLDNRSLICKPDDGDHTRTQRCSRWCLETWGMMADAVERARTAAKAEGVDIVSLR